MLSPIFRLVILLILGLGMFLISALAHKSNQAVTKEDTVENYSDTVQDKSTIKKELKSTKADSTQNALDSTGITWKKWESKQKTNITF